MIRRCAASLIAATVIASVGIMSPSSAYALSDGEAQLFGLLNGARAENHLAALTDTGDLDVLARRHSADMAAAGEIYHSRNLPDQVGGCWTLLGENVGVGPSVADVHDALMRSPSHRDNIMGEYNQVGIGVVSADDGQVYITQTFAQRTCGTAKKVSKARPHVRAQARRTPPPRAMRAHLRSASSPVVPSQNVDMLVRVLELDANRTTNGA